MQCLHNNRITTLCVSGCRTVETIRKVISASAALRDFTVSSEVSSMTVSPAPAPSPTQKTSTIYPFGVVSKVTRFLMQIPIVFLSLVLKSFSPTCVAEGFDDYRCTACPEGYEGKYCERSDT